MRRLLATPLLAVPLVAVAVLGLVSPEPSAAAVPARDAPWRGDRDASPSAYAWLNGDEPTDTYAITVVRGLRTGQVLRVLGGAEKDLGDRTPDSAGRYYVNRIDRFYEGPPVAQVDALGPAVVVYTPYGFPKDEALARLSRHGVVASFTTTVELDTYVTVARRGEVIRQFDAGFRPPAQGALPQEAGLDWGSRDQNVFATAWAFNERLTRIHVSQDWFEGDHPTYVVAEDGGLY